MKKLLLIPGSLRKHSFNKSLAMIAEEYLKTKPEVEVSVLDYSKLPVLNMDDSYPFPETVNEVREKISEADGLWFFCPEYNGSIPGGLKNMLDYASLSYERNNFASGSPLRGKFAAQSGCGGKMATAGAQAALTTLLKRCGCKVMTEDMVKIAVPMESFASGIYEPTPEVKEELIKEATAFLTFMGE